MGTTERDDWDEATTEWEDAAEAVTTPAGFAPVAPAIEPTHDPLHDPKLVARRLSGRVARQTVELPINWQP
jgi:hypothetical protein